MLVMELERGVKKMETDVVIEEAIDQIEKHLATKGSAA